MSEEWVIIVIWGGRCYHKPVWKPDTTTPASHRLGTECGLDVSGHDLTLHPKSRVATSDLWSTPCKRCYPKEE